MLEEGVRSSRALQGGWMGLWEKKGSNTGEPVSCGQTDGLRPAEGPDEHGLAWF